MRRLGTYDVEGNERAAIHGLVDFADKHVFEVGCSEGRMTWLYADSAASVFAFDPDDEVIATARARTPDALRSKVEFRVADLLEVDLEPQRYDIGLFAWSI